MPEAKQKHHTDLSETKSPKRSSPRKRGPKASRSRGKSLAETEPAILDSRSPQWGALAAGCEALRLSKPDERAEAGRALDDAAGDLLFALGHRYYSTGLPDLPGAPRLPQEAAGWADLLRRIERVHKLLGTGPLNSDVAERCEFVLGQFFRAIPWMMRQAESNAAPLPPLPATSYHVEREQPSEDGPGRLPKHRDSTSPTTGPARSEVTKRSEERRVGKECA